MDEEFAAKLDARARTAHPEKMGREWPTAGVVRRFR